MHTNTHSNSSSSSEEDDFHLAPQAPSNLQIIPYDDELQHESHPQCPPLLPFEPPPPPPPPLHLVTSASLRIVDHIPLASSDSISLPSNRTSENDLHVHRIDTSLNFATNYHPNANTSFVPKQPRRNSITIRGGRSGSSASTPPTSTTPTSGAGAGANTETDCPISGIYTTNTTACTGMMNWDCGINPQGSSTGSSRIYSPMLRTKYIQLNRHKVANSDLLPNTPQKPPTLPNPLFSPPLVSSYFDDVAPTHRRNHSGGGIPTTICQIRRPVSTPAEVAAAAAAAALTIPPAVTDYEKLSERGLFRSDLENHMSKIEEVTKFQIFEMLNKNKLQDLSKFMLRRNRLNKLNITLIYIFYVFQTAGIFLTAASSKPDYQALLWVGISLNFFASVINTFEHINNSISEKTLADIVAIKEGNYIDERIVVDEQFL